jgi:hypothetical protein
MLRRRGLLGDDGLRRSIARTLAGSLVLFAWCFWLARVLERSGRGAEWTLAALVTGMLVYVAATAAMRAPELGALSSMLTRRR